MQNSIAWIVSAVLSVAAHYGLMAVAAQIPLPQSGEQPLAEVLLGNASFQAVTLDAAAGAQGAEIQTADTLTETSTAVDQEMMPADAVEAGPQQTEEIAQSASAPDTSSASAAAELAPDGTAETASQPGNDAEAKAATPATDVAAESPSELTQDTAAAPSTEAPQAVAPLAPAREASTTALLEQDSAAIATTPAPSAETSSAAAPVVEAPPADEALPEGSIATVEASVAEVSSVGSTPELVPSKPAESAPALAAGTKMAAAVTAPAPVLSQGDRVRSFMRNYQGNGCIYAQANDTDAARPSFKGLGGESGAVSDFAAAFKQAVGIEPELALRAVMDPQCPAVDFISTISGGERQNLEVVLDQEVVQDGGMLIGRLEGRVQGEIMLLLVDDDGAVRDITSEFHLLPTGNFFGVGVSLQGEGRGRNQLVLALASLEPLGITVTRKPGEAATLFRNLARKIEGDGIPVRTAYAAFRVE